MKSYVDVGIGVALALGFSFATFMWFMSDIGVPYPVVKTTYDDNECVFPDGTKIEIQYSHEEYKTNWRVEGCDRIETGEETIWKYFTFRL